VRDIGTYACPSTRGDYVLQYCVDVEIHRTARRHGISDNVIRHALDHAIAVFDLEPDADPPKVLAIGPDPAGNLLEIIWLELEEVNLVIHAMPLRAQFYDLLPQSPEDLR
jgi:hypothetical protein